MLYIVYIRLVLSNVIVALRDHPSDEVSCNISIEDQMHVSTLLPTQMHSSEEGQTLQVFQCFRNDRVDVVNLFEPMKKETYLTLWMNAIGGCYQ